MQETQVYTNGKDSVTTVTKYTNPHEQRIVTSTVYGAKNTTLLTKDQLNTYKQQGTYFIFSHCTIKILLNSYSNQ